MHKGAGMRRTSVAYLLFVPTILSPQTRAQVITTFVATGVAGYSGGGRPATLAPFNGPWGVAAAADDDV